MKRKFVSEEEERAYYEARKEFVRRRNAAIRAELEKHKAKLAAAGTDVHTAPPEGV